jgi:glycosyl transferase family 25
MINKIFNKIYYINLDRRPDRNEHMKNIMKENDFNAERIPAVDGSKLNLDNVTNTVTDKGLNDAKNIHQKVYTPLTPGAIGCAMTHRNIWQKIVDENIPNALILEDDIRVNFGNNKLQKISENMPYYDILFLGYNDCVFKYFITSVNDQFIRTTMVAGLYGYAVSKQGAQKLLKLFPISLQLDSEISKKLKTFNAYLVKPDYRIIFSDPSENAIEFGTDIQVRDYDYFMDNNKNMVKTSNVILQIFLFLFVIFICVIVYFLILSFAK